MYVCVPRKMGKIGKERRRRRKWWWGEVLNRFLGDESVSLPDTICVQLLHVHVELLPSFLFSSVFVQGYIVYFFGIYCTYACDLGFFDLDLFFLIFCWIARSQAAMRNVSTVPSVGMQEM